MFQCVSVGFSDVLGCYSGFQMVSGAFLGVSWGFSDAFLGVFMGLQGCYSEFQGSSSELH